MQICYGRGGKLAFATNWEIDASRWHGISKVDASIGYGVSFMGMAVYFVLLRIHSADVSIVCEPIAWHHTSSIAVIVWNP